MLGQIEHLRKIREQERIKEQQVSFEFTTTIVYLKIHEGEPTARRRKCSNRCKI